MRVKSLRPGLVIYLEKRGLGKKFQKQIQLFSSNPRHPSLHTEILEPRTLKIYSFRIDQKYRAVFILVKSGLAEIVDINDHYNK